MQLEADLDFYLTGPEKGKEPFNEDQVTDMPVEELEDNQEEVNFNIHAEILADANEFLNTYDEAILNDEDKMWKRKEWILEILNEIEALI